MEEAKRGREEKKHVKARNEEAVAQIKKRGLKRWLRTLHKQKPKVSF